MTSALEATVFVVDDDAAMREAIRELARSMGLNVQCFAGAGEFLESYPTDQPGCLILDVRMPGMSGIELQENLVSAGVLLPVIVITGHGDLNTGVRATRRGALEVLEKPFDPQVLEETIRRAIRVDAQQRKEQSHRRKIEEQIARLTPGERLVLDQIVAGKTNKTIALDLDISLRTVQSRVAGIMGKMQVDSLAALLVMVLPILRPPKDAP